MLHLRLVDIHQKQTTKLCHSIAAPLSLSFVAQSPQNCSTGYSGCVAKSVCASLGSGAARFVRNDLAKFSPLSTATRVIFFASSCSGTGIGAAPSGGLSRVL